MRLKQNHWVKICTMPNTDSKHCPAVCRGGRVGCERARTGRTRREGEERLARYLQQATSPHWSVTMFPRLLALLVAPRKRNKGENPSELRCRMMR